MVTSSFTSPSYLSYFFSLYAFFSLLGHAFLFVSYVPKHTQGVSSNLNIRARFHASTAVHASLHSCEPLRSVGWWLVFDGSGQTIRPIFKGQADEGRTLFLRSEGHFGYKVKKSDLFI
jgi:hypothetical protein